MNLDKLAPALVAFQADLKPVEKGKVNPFYKSNYADLPSVMVSIQPLLEKHKLAVSQFPTNIEGKSALRTLLIHESGQYLEDVAPLMLSKDTAQEQGSAMTYSRRYGVMSVLGIVADEDDDGNKASGKTDVKQINKPHISASTTAPASEKQKSLIRKLAKEAGTPDEAIEARLKEIVTSAQASEAIGKLMA